MHRGSINGIPGGNQVSLGGMGMGAGIGNSRSPVKESYLNRSASLDEAGNVREDNNEEEEEEEKKNLEVEMSISPPPKAEGIPIRR